MVSLKELSQHVFIIGFVGSACTLIYSTVFSSKPILSSVSTLAGTLSVLGYVGIERLNDRERLENQLSEKDQTVLTLESELSRIQGERESLKLTLERFLNPDGTLIDVSGLKLNLSVLQADLEELNARLDNYTKELVKVTTERNTLTQNLEGYRVKITELEANKQEWSRRFDQIILEHLQEQKLKDTEIEKLHSQISELNVKVIRYETASDSIHETAKLRATAECRQIEDRLNSLNAEYSEALEKYKQVASLYNQLRSEHIALSDEYATEFTELNEAVSKAIPTKFNEVLTERDRELMRLAGLVESLSKPRKFEAVGEFIRADKLIDLIYESEHRIVLDAVEIIPNDEKGSFKAYYWVRGNAGGKTTVDALNELTDSLAEQLFCIQPIKFEFDLQNPHRIGATFTYRKAKVTRETISKLWKTSDQFVSIAGKWSRVRITGGSESGKSPLAELVAGSMQQIKPAVQIKLAFPKEGSEKNHWGIPVTYSTWKGCLDAAVDARKLMNSRDKGSDNSKYFYAPIIDETDTALDKYPDLATEIKALIKSGSHNNVGLILCGQNANVRQWKGFDRSDFENVVNVHIGSNAFHAIENSHISEAEKKRLKDIADKLTSFCESQNLDIADEDIKIRFALVLEPNKKGYFIEIPRFGSIHFDSFKVSSLLDVELNEKPETVDCQHLNSVIRKTYRDREGNPIRRNRKCKDCQKSFTEYLEPKNLIRSLSASHPSETA